MTDEEFNCNFVNNLGGFISFEKRNIYKYMFLNNYTRR